ncbi:substrate-binding domain-containing protein [Actinocorallia sp. A-T 12471]|uniref:substrate-binding domain-containing protein n=1 Tax=Actinocorallia sp. A-T 12471 TaxID=3089813 RepID=UPI0029CBD255|nr:substrate-binding domain-containing protein [Actinocorallia sp. A-T 12471]MDX6739115.1 substrate-binding domain-containing protein [Actinocorallia sp. A-T 12471]
MTRRIAAALAAVVLAFCATAAADPKTGETATPTATPGPSESPSPSPDPETPVEPTDPPTEPEYPGNTKGKVTLDQSTDLVNQVIRVSWRGFTPSSDTFLSDSTTHVVRVYQCRGKQPESVADCYGSGSFTYPDKPKGGGVLPDGPTNAVTALTAPNGRGYADIEVRTIAESASLACDAVDDCSIVVIPNDGDPTRPTLAGQLATQAYLDSDWAWANRIVAPIGFAVTAATCALEDADFRITGSPQAKRLIERWQPGLCTSKADLDVDYTSLGEPLARSSFQTNGTDVALTSRPEDTAPSRAFDYAPVGISGIAVAYRVDDADTGKPITGIKLTPRLVAKLLTTSYSMNAACGPGVKDCNKATAGNPQDIFQDPEFLKLNGDERSWPSMAWPTVVSGDNDLTYELTRWLAADPEAAAFLKGAKAPGGMTVNRNFKGAEFPTSAFVSRDPDKRFVHGFIPVFGLSDVARYLVTNRDNSENYVKDQYGNYVKTGPYAIGNRGLFAVVSTSDAQALRFSAARLRNAAGKYVAPTDASMAAALKHLKTNADGVTQLPDYTAKDPKAYPLTHVQYAEVPTNGVEAAKARKIAAFLEHAAGPGQKAGIKPGTRPVGYVPLSAAMRAQTKKAAKNVIAQKGKIPEPPGAAAPAAPVEPDTPEPATLPVIQAGAPAPMGGRLSADAAALFGWLLPALLGCGVGAALLGPILYAAGRFGLAVPARPSPRLPFAIPRGVGRRRKP